MHRRLSHTRASTSRDIRRPGSSPSLALAFVGKQLLAFELKSLWWGGGVDVMLRGSRDLSQSNSLQPVCALGASPNSTRAGTTCGSAPSDQRGWRAKIPRFSLKPLQCSEQEGEKSHQPVS